MLIHNTNHENENCFWGLTRAMQFESISMYRSVARCTRVTLRKTCLPGSRILALAMPGGCARRSAGDCRLAVFKGNLSRKLAQQRAIPSVVSEGRIGSAGRPFVLFGGRISCFVPSDGTDCPQIVVHTFNHFLFYFCSQNQFLFNNIRRISPLSLVTPAENVLK